MDASDAEVAFYVAEADEVTKAPDVAEVKEALEMWGRFGPPRGNNPGTPMSDLNAIVDAARRWVRMAETGEQVWHCFEGSHDVECYRWRKTDDPDDHARCGLVVVAAVGVEKEKS